MSVKTEQRKLQERVRTILLVDEDARSSDDRLYLAVINQISAEKGFNPNGITLPNFLLKRKAYGFPNYESVGRARRKIQENDETLRADPNVEAMRELKEEEYREWAVEEKMN